METQDQRRDLIAHYRQAAQAAFQAERAATCDFTLIGASGETTLYSARHLDRLGLIDELLFETINDNERAQYRPLVDEILSGKGSKTARLPRLNAFVQNMIIKSAEENAGAAMTKSSARTRRIDGFDSILLVLVGASNYPLESQDILGVNSANAAAAISLLRGTIETEEFLVSLRQKSEELKVKQIKIGLEAAMTPIIRQPPLVLLPLIFETVQILGEEKTKELVISSWLEVEQAFDLTVSQKEIIRAGQDFVERNEFPDYNQLGLCMLSLLGQSEQLESGSIPAKSLDIAPQLALGLSEFAQALVGSAPDAKTVSGQKTFFDKREEIWNSCWNEWAAALQKAQELLFFGRDIPRQEKSVDKIFVAAASVERLEARPTVSDLEEWFNTPSDPAIGGSSEDLEQ